MYPSIFLIIAVPLLLSGCDSKFWKPLQCLETSKVVEIEAIIYRGGIVRLENGLSVDVGQPHEPVKVGSEWCVKYSR